MRRPQGERKAKAPKASAKSSSQPQSSSEWPPYTSEMMAEMMQHWPMMVFPPPPAHPMGLPPGLSDGSMRATPYLTTEEAVLAAHASAIAASVAASAAWQQAASPWKGGARSQGWHKGSPSKGASKGRQRHQSKGASKGPEGFGSKGANKAPKGSADSGQLACATSPPVTSLPLSEAPSYSQGCALDCDVPGVPIGFDHSGKRIGDRAASPMSIVLQDLKGFTPAGSTGPMAGSADVNATAVSTVDSAADAPAMPTTLMPEEISRGSRLCMELGVCKPCGFFHKRKEGNCIHKDNCDFCHIKTHPPPSNPNKHLRRSGKKRADPPSNRAAGVDETSEQKPASAEQRDMNLESQPKLAAERDVTPEKKPENFHVRDITPQKVSPRPAYQ